MNTLLHNLRYAVRLLRTNPAFTAVAVLTLGLGIGANTAIFTVVDAALLRSLPYKEPDRLVHLWESNQQQEPSQREFSYPDFLDLKDDAQLFQDVAGYNGMNVTLTGRDVTERLQAVRVAANFFSVLGIDAAIGRTFAEGEDRPGSAPLVVINYGLWERRFGSDPNLIGQTLSLSGTNYTVIGILPPHFQFAPIGDGELWINLRPSAIEVSRRFMHWVSVIGRLNPGVTLDQAQAGTQAIAQRLEDADPQYHQGAIVRVIPLREQIVGPVKPLLFVLVGTVLFVLLIACSNIANLLLARSTARKKEMAIRRALGASRWRIINQLLTESVLLALIGGALGLLIAQWGLQLLLAPIPLTRMPYLQALGIDWRVLVFTSLLSLFTGVLFGLGPALEGSKQNLSESLKEGGRTSSTTSGRRLRNLLVVSEMTLALVLLVGAGLMAKSLVKLTRVDTGFDPENLLTFQLSLPAAKYGASSQAAAFYEQLMARLEALPGVKGAGAVNRLPLGGGNTGTLIIDGRPARSPGETPLANVRTVTTGYFDAMRIPLMEGRPLTERDNMDSPRVVVVNRTLVAQSFPDQNPIGQRIRFPFTGDQRFEIVGVVGDEKVVPLDTATTPVVYFPQLQDSDRTMTVVVRASTDPLGLAAAARGEVRALDPDLLVYHVESMEQYISRLPSIFIRRYPAMLIGSFAAVALVLATIGIYGIISYSVNQRGREFAIRVALGASRRNIVRLVLGEGVMLGVIGIGTGSVAALVLTRFLSTMLFGVSATDPLTFTAGAIFLAAVAMTACYVPALRATKVDPMVSLRCE